MIDLAQAASYLDLLAEGEPVTFQAFDDAGNSRSLARILHGELDQHAPELSALNERGAGIFVMPNRGDGKGRTAKNVIGILAVFVDLDGAPLAPVLTAGLEPHIVVESSPGRFHAYWLAADCPLDRFTPLQRALARRFNGDTKVCDLPRVMRLPGFVHRKGTPFMTRILSLAAIQPYPVQTIVGALALDEAGTTKTRTAPATQPAGAIIAGGRNNALARMGGTMARKGMGLTAIEAALLAENAARCTPPLADDEVRGIARSVSRYPASSPASTAPLPPDDAEWRGSMPPGGSSVWQRPTARLRSGSTLVVRRASDVQPEPINWLWPGKIAIGKLTLIAGDPGLGKSMLTVNLAAHVSTGRNWPARGGSCPIGDVLFVSAEDDPADTIRPRLDAAGADSSRVFIVAGVESLNTDGTPERRLLSLRKDLAAVIAAVRALDNCRLIVVDPVSAYLDGADSHNNAEVRGLLAPLSELAREVGAAMIAVTHLNKGAGGSALYRTTGSLAFVAAARAAWLVTRDKLDAKKRLFLPLKNNLGPDTTGMSYFIQETGGVPFVEWDSEPVTISADDALGKPDDADHESTLAEDAAEWLRDVLAGGPVPAKEVMTHGSNAGYSAATIRRAQASIGIKPKRLGGTAGDGKWVWSLPEGQEGHQMSLGVSA